MSGQLGRWEGDFGGEYTDRNVPDWHATTAGFEQMIGGLGIESAVEIGCNRGHNLLSVHDVLGPDSEVVGIEPNLHALALACALPGVRALRGQASEIPLADGAFDLAFTVGVLIHIGPDDLPAAMREIARVSRKYILAAEYGATTETAVRYRGLDDMLWKNDFGALYLEEVAGLQLVRQGELGHEDGFDDVTWWLLERCA